MNSNKNVSFSSDIFYKILDNLYISDQISSFDCNLIKKHNIQCLINCTKNSPFISEETIHIKIHIFCNELILSNDICKSIDKTISIIKYLLKNKIGILIYCESGFHKSIPLIICFLLKYNKQKDLLDMESCIRYIRKKTGLLHIQQCKYLYVCKYYRDYLLDFLWNHKEKPLLESKANLDDVSVKKSFFYLIKKHFAY
jgi:hypothetical protein